jgi:hypothetical protein
MSSYTAHLHESAPLHAGRQLVADDPEVEDAGLVGDSLGDVVDGDEVVLIQEADLGVRLDGLRPDPG